MKKSINADIPGSISELQAAMKEFLLKYKLYQILLRGKGLEFEAYRTYFPDDDASAIDWKASKRTNSLLVKQYRNEKDLKIIFLVDIGDNMVFGSSEKLKCEYAAEVVAAFAHLIITSGDKVGFILFNDKVQKFVPPSGGKKQFFRFMDEITNPEAYSSASNIDAALDFALTYLHNSISSVIVVSDFISFKETSEKKLSLMGNKFETVALVIRDPLDSELPDFAGEIVLEDPKSGQQILINPHIAKDAYKNITSKKEALLKKVCLEDKIDLLELNTSERFVPTLAGFLKWRTKTK